MKTRHWPWPSTKWTKPMSLCKINSSPKKPAASSFHGFKTIFNPSETNFGWALIYGNNSIAGIASHSQTFHRTKSNAEKMQWTTDYCTYLFHCPAQNGSSLVRQQTIRK
jgi:hypothetical protein